MTIPKVQTKLAHYFTEKINNENNVNIHIDKIQITLAGKIVLKNFLVLDEKKDTLFSGKNLETYVKDIRAFYNNNKLVLENASINGLKAKIINYKNTKQLNIETFINNIDKSSKSVNKSKNPFVLKINKVKLINSRLRYYDKTIKKKPILDLKKFNSIVDNFKIIGPKVIFNLRKTSFKDSHDIIVNELSSDFSYDKQNIKIENFNINTDNSSVKMNIIFNAKNGYANFINKVNLKGEINKTIIGTNDIIKLTNIFGTNQKINISGKISGTINNLNIKNLKIITDNNIDFDGKLKIFNLSNTKKIKISTYFNKLNFSFKKIEKLLKPTLNNTFTEKLLNIKNIHSEGVFSYNADNIKANIKSLSDLGKFNVDMTMSNLSSIAKINYKAHITTNNLNLNKIINANMKNVDSNLKIAGSGLNLQSLNSNFEGSIKQISYNGYLYKNLNIDGIFKNKLFKGWFSIDDKNLEMDFKGLMDFSHKKYAMKFSSEVCEANLHELNLIKKDSIAKFKGLINIDAVGNNLDNVIGQLTLKNVEYVNQSNRYQFDNFKAISIFKDSIRHINFISNDIISGNINGNFRIKNIPLIVKNALGSVFANFKPIPFNEHQFIHYKLKLANKVVNLFYPKLKIASGTTIKGKMDSKENQFKFKLKSDKINYGNNSLKDIKLDIDNKNLLYNIFLKIDTIKTSLYTVRKLRLLNTTINDTLYLKTKFEGGNKYKDKYNLSFFYTMDDLQNFIFGLKKSSFVFKDRPWYINPKTNKNHILYSPYIDSLFIEDVGISHKEEKFSVTGYKFKKNTDMTIKLEKINLAHISPENDFIFRGFANGMVHIKNYGNDILPTAELKIKDFKMNNENLGDVSLKINTLKGNIVFADINIDKNKERTVKINGYLDFGKKKPVINASVFLEQFPVTPLAPLFKDIFDNVRGNWTGNIQIKGNLNNPNFNGKIYLNDFGLKILAINTDYQFKNNTIVELKKQRFIFKNQEFEDIKYHTKGKLSGIIKHHNFGNWYLDLKINTNNILALDTPVNPEELFYGKIFVKGDATIHGYVNKLIIDANMKTEKGTDFVLTLNDVEKESKNDFIRIVSLNDYKKSKKIKKKLNKIYEGLEMNFDLDITPDAKVTIIMDQEYGSYLESKGLGGMLLEINTNGKFNIWGDFTVLNGIYNFKYWGLIDKKFKVEPGSYISWEGDPYEANMDIKATYETIANPYVLLNTKQDVNKKNIPIRVITYLKESLMHPKITLDLELPKANSILKSQIDYILSDPDKKKLQVMSLLSLGTFINENDYNFNVAEGAVETISERGLNILNTLLNQDENFKVNLKYKGATNNVEKNLKIDPQVGLTLTTKINKRIYINGSVAIPVGRYTKSSIVGDMEIEVYLDKEGNLKFRFFNKQTQLEYIGQQEGYTQGIGLSYQVEFDTMKEILQRIGINLSKKKPN